MKFRRESSAGFKLAAWRKRLCGMLVPLILAGSPCLAADARATEIHPGVWEFEFVSSVLGRTGRFCLAVPDPIQRTPGDWPVLFLLHGRGRNQRSLVDVEGMRRAFLDAPFCTVFPQGDDGWYINSPVRLEDRYETYLEEVLEIAATVRPISRDRNRRAITGWSMGGYGAMRFATRHPEDFAVVAGIIGLLDFPRPATLPEGQNYAVPVARFGDDPSRWAAFNPLEAAEALRGLSVLIVTAADAHDRTMNEHFHARLRSLGIPHEYLVLPGAHTFPVVQAALPRVIDFVARGFSSRTPPEPPGNWPRS